MDVKERRQPHRRLALPVGVVVCLAAVSFWLTGPSEQFTLFCVLAPLGIAACWLASSLFLVLARLLTPPGERKEGVYSEEQRAFVHLYNWGVWVVIVGAFLIAPAFCTGVGGPTWQRASCERTLRTIGQALRQYHSEYGCYPPRYTTDATGRRLHSWRVLCLPYLDVVDGQELFDRLHLDEPWDSQYNRGVLDGSDVCRYFQCPSERMRRTGQHAPHSQDASYLALPVDDAPTGAEESALTVDAGKSPHPVFGAFETTASGIHWAEPRDLETVGSPEGVDLRDALRSHHWRGANVLLGDDYVEYVRNSVSAAELKAMLRQWCAPGVTVEED